MTISTWNGRTKPATALETERVIAWTFVAFAHVLLGWMVTRPSSSPRTESDPPMQLVFIQPLALPATKAASTRNPPKIPSMRKETHLTAQPDKHSPAPAPDHASAVRPMQLTTADDHWETLPDASKADPIRISRSNPMRHVNPIQAGSPGRFRMRGQVSPADIVRAVSMGLFWPPGYTDDPCPGINKAVQTLAGSSSERERKLLEDAALQQSRYCS